MPTPNSKNKAKSDPKTKKATKPVDETPDMDERDEAEQTDEQPADDRLDMDDQDDGQANDPAPPKQPPATQQQEPPRGRQGDQNRPTCPQCSKPNRPVLCKADGTKTFFTWYKCEKCGWRTKVARPQISERVRRSRRGQDLSVR